MDIGVSVYQEIRTLPIPEDIYSPIALKLTIIYVLIRNYACVLHRKMCTSIYSKYEMEIISMG